MSDHLESGVMETTIYGLIDPRTLELRYVGKTSQGLKRRLHEHRNDATVRRKNLYSSKWLRLVYAAGMSPKYEIYEVVPDGGDWIAAEKRWIAHWRSMGAKLTNLTDGGEGLAGMKRPQHVIDAVRAFNLGSKRSEEAKAKMRAAWTPERRAAMGALKRAAEYDEKTRKRMSDSAKQRVRTPDELARGAERLRLVDRSSPEMRAKISAGQIASWANRKRHAENFHRS